MNRAERKSEVEAKLTRLRERMAAEKVDAVSLHLSANTAWITAGAATYVNEATEGGPSWVLVTPTHAYVMTDTIEGTRLRSEEKLADLGFELIIEPWYARNRAQEMLQTFRYTAQDGSGNGLDFAHDLKMLRSVLQEPEIKRMKHVCKLASEAMDAAIRSVEPGQTEYQIAAKLASECRTRGGSPIVNLIASDDRIYQYRHPLPTAKKVDRYAMAVVCMRYEGLIGAVTRLVHFGKLSRELHELAMAVAQVDAHLILSTQAGRTLGEMFDIARGCYQERGYHEAIDQHHQGGSIAYAGREFIARPGESVQIQQNQAFAWNPSISGAKSEDTIFLGAGGIEVLTETPDWPTWEIEFSGTKIARPAILEVG